MALEALLKRYEVVERAVSVTLLQDEAMQALNRQWRGVDAPTDVLSFPVEPVPHLPLGDVVINVDQARRQAASLGHSLDHEIAILAIHGGLHLLGLDDETDEQRDAMRAAMDEVAADIGLKIPYDWATQSPPGGSVGSHA